MSENKDIQKVENDKDKIEYEKFHWEISAIKRFNICIVIIVCQEVCFLDKRCCHRLATHTKNRLKCYCHTFRIHNQTNRQTLFNETRRNPNSC